MPNSANKTYVTLSAEFCAGHLYEQKKWTPEKNLETFGKCYSPFGHGHNYRVEVTFESGKDFNFNQSQQHLSAVADVLDHKHLNHEIDFFKDRIPTTENIAFYFAEKLKSPILKKIRLFESANLFTELELVN